MAEFLDSEAELDDTDEESEGIGSGSEDEMPRKKKTKKKKKKRINILSDDEEEGEDLDQDLEDLIDDREVVDDEDDDNDEESGKRAHEDSELEEDLEDEDYDLIEENLGIKVKKHKHKRRRIRRLGSDDESDKEDDEDDREVIAKEIFEGGDEEGDDVEGGDHEEEEKMDEPPLPSMDLEDSEEESDEDNWIVDDEGQPISKGKKKKKHIIHEDAALQEAQDIFGVDFDFEEFEQYRDDEEELEEEEEEEDAEAEVGEDGEPRPRPAKTTKRKGRKNTIYQIFEPDELERGHFTDLDQEIRMADMPERFHLRGIPVCPTEEEGELEEEAQWVFKYAFNQPTVSRQEGEQAERPGGIASGVQQRDPGTADKIRDALNFMRNQQFEVPFIAFYRKEYVEPELNISDLWKVYQWDEKWMQLRQRKQNLVRLFEKMQEYQFDQIDPDQPLESHIRALTEEDLDRVKNVCSLEELRDVYQHFLLHYGHEVPKMKVALRAKAKQRREAAGDEAPDEEEPEEEHETLKQASRKTGYTICLQAGLAELARKFGLTPEQFGVNLRDNYQRHEVEQDPAEPHELAAEFIKGQFRTVDDVLKGARHMVAMQIAHDPQVRQAVREIFSDRCKICIQPTKKGIKEIDENNPTYTMKYVKDKPVRDLEEDQFLKLCMAEEDGLLTFELYLDMKDSNNTYFKEIEQLYHRDEFSHLVQEWNNQRSFAVERALTMILYPQMVREIRGKLLYEAKQSVIKMCCRRLYDWLKVAPYHADQQLDEDDDAFDSSKGLRVMGVAYSIDKDDASFCCIVDRDGEVTDYIRNMYLLNRNKAHFAKDRTDKEKDMKKIKNFIASKKPHVIAVAGESRDAIRIMEDIRALVTELEQEHQMAPINVELVENELSAVFASCKKAEQDFRTYPPLLKQAISVARRVQDPLIEFAQLCNSDEDILSLKYHQLQDQVTKEELLNALYLEFVNRVNEVGVDVNRCVVHSHTSPIVQFVCGLGPRKGYHLLKILKQNNSRLENRTQLVTMCNMGPKVFINCAGFIRIDTTALGDSTEAYVEVLDGSRVHPETYEWARKMAVDALEYDDSAEDANPAGALEEILESPERLKDLDLDAFAEELQRQGYGNKHITLYDIRAELNQRYKDLRQPFRSPSAEERFNMLTKETPATFHIGKLILSQVTGMAYRRPRGEELDNANPVRDPDTQLWQCPFCQKNDFPELSEVWNHFDAGECPGQAVGVRTRLDNSVNGFIHIKNLSDKRVSHPEDRVKVKMLLHARIIKIEIEKFTVDLTTKTSDLMDKEGRWRLQKDAYYDFKTEEDEVQKEKNKLQQKARQTYVKRVIAHPSFHNIDYKMCERMMVNMDQGDVIFRPSSKGTEHLTATWKVADGIAQHIDVQEEQKENAFSLGKLLIIGKEEFEDLDEIVARYIQPLAAFVREILNYKYYLDSEGGKREILDRVLIDEKRKGPSKIPYYFSSVKQYPGKFYLSYLPRKTPKHELVTIVPEGLRYRSRNFHSISSLVRWFKEHFRDPIPGGTPGPMRTPAHMAATPSHGLQGVDAATIQRATAGLPNSVFNTLAQVAGNTPGFPQAQQGMGQQRQMPTPMLTPMVTPSYHGHLGNTPSQQQQQMSTTPRHIGTPSHMPGNTPQYKAPTPRHSWGSGPASTPKRNAPANPIPAAGSGLSNTSQDWAKMAEVWAKERQAQQRGQVTPRDVEQSPMAGGDATPLIDER